eukprot:6436070-Amphidinium_carterae.1
MRTDNEGSIKFLRTHAKVWRLVLPEGDVNKILSSAKGTKWADLADEVGRVCQASPLGARLFDFALAEVCESVVKSRINAIIKMLGAGGRLDESSVRKARNDAKDSLRSVTGVCNLADRREIELQYRGWDMKVQVRSLEEEVSVRVMCAVRGWISAQKEVKALPGEVELCTETGPAFTHVEHDLKGPIEASRKELITLMNALTVQNGDSLKAVGDDYCTSSDKYKT